MIIGDSREDRISNWFEYFSNLLGKDSSIVDKLPENIDNMLTLTDDNKPQ